MPNKRFEFARCACPTRNREALWQMVRMHNKPLVPTRNGEAPLLAAQRGRWAEVK
jgi:hypothetical protein